RSRIGAADAVFVTGIGSHPDIITLVGLAYDPEQWQRDAPEKVQGPLASGAYAYEDIYVHVGKLHFLFDNYSYPALQALLNNGRTDHVIFIVRPGELGLQNRGAPVLEIREPHGAPTLWVFELDI